jgi:hypothetical protein
MLDPWVGERLDTCTSRLGRGLLLLDCGTGRGSALLGTAAPLGKDDACGVETVGLAIGLWLGIPGTVEFGLVSLLLVCRLVGFPRWLGEAAGLCDESVSLMTAGSNPSISQGLGFGTPVVSTASGVVTESGSLLGSLSLLGFALCGGNRAGSLPCRWLSLGLSLGAMLGCLLAATG